jgi:hypothetical protein
LWFCRNQFVESLTPNSNLTIKKFRIRSHLEFALGLKGDFGKMNRCRLVPIVTVELANPCSVWQGVVKERNIMAIFALDLTKQAPRSPRVRLGGFVILPRCLDKGRATIIGKNGEYHYDCPLDQRFLNFVGIKADALKKQLATGKGDGEMLAWITANAKFKRSELEIAQWSTWVEQRFPTDTETREYVNANHKKYGPKREDIGTFFDLLDLDDYVSFGGKP